jgi:WD40 repeat protein
VFSPDGKLLATGHASGKVRLWNLAERREQVFPAENPRNIMALAFSGDGTQLWAGAWAQGSHLWTWDVRSGRAVGAPVAIPGLFWEFRPDLKAIAVHVGNSAVHVIDRLTKKPLGPVLWDRNHRSGPSEISFSPDGLSLATGESNDDQPGVSRAAIGWDIATGKARFQTGKHDGYHIFAIAWSPDGATVATGGHDHTLRLWDSKTGALKGLPRAFSQQVAILKYSPDGRALAVGLGGRSSHYHSPGTVRIVNSRTCDPLGPEWAFETGVWCLAFSPEGDAVAVGLSDGTTQVRTLPQINPLGRPLDLTSNCSTLAATADGRLAFAMGSSSGEIRMSDPRTGRFRALIMIPRAVWSMVFAPDDKTLAIGTGFSFSTNEGPPDAEVLVYDTEREEWTCPPIRVGESSANALGFSRDGKILYTKSVDRKTVRLWDTKTGENQGRDITGDADVTDTAVSPDDRFVFQSDRHGRVKRRHLDGNSHDPETWALQPPGIERIAVNPDGRSLLTRSVDQAVRLWDIETGRPLGPPIEHDSMCRVQVMSPDGRTLATGTMDGIIRFWDAPTGLPLGPPRPQKMESIAKLLFLSYGSRLAVGSDEHGCRVMETPSEVVGAVTEVRRWAEGRARWTLDRAGSVTRLSTAQWEERRRSPSPDAAIPPDSISAEAAASDRHLAIAAFCLRDDSYAAIWHLDRPPAHGASAEAIYEMRAYANARTRNVERALEDLERLLTLDPKTNTMRSSVVQVLAMLPETDRVGAVEDFALSRYLSGARPALELTIPGCLEMAVRCSSRHRWDLAAALLIEAINDDFELTRFDRNQFSDKYTVSLIMGGDLAACRSYLAARFALFAAGKLRVNPFAFLWLCLRRRGAFGDPEALIRQTELVLKPSKNDWHKVVCLSWAAAAYYRADRLDECLSRLEESSKLRKGQSPVNDWAFLAMAHARKGHRDEAMKWLKQLRAFKSPDSPNKFWDEQSLAVLRQEAEAVVLYDPVFPRIPFTR